MALFSSKGSDVPKDHIALTRDEAVEFQLDIISTLAPKKNSIFIKFGPSATSVLGLTTSIFINGLYRQCVNIGNVNRIYTSIPCTLLPALSHLLLHKRFVRDDIIIQKWACNYCYQTRSSLLQVFFGLLLPIATSAVTAFANARRMKVPGVPALNNPEIFKFFVQKTRPFSRSFGGIFILHLITGGLIAQGVVMENNYFNTNIEFFITEYEKNKAKHKKNVGKVGK